jgi:hypothetical protein
VKIRGEKSRQRCHPHQVRRELLQLGRQVRVDPHVEDTDIVVRNRCGKHLQRQRFRHCHEAESKLRRRAVRLNQQDSHVNPGVFSCLSLTDP